MMLLLSIARRRGIKIVWTVHNLGAHYQRDYPDLEKRYWPRVARHLDALISLSKSGVERLRGVGENCLESSLSTPTGRAVRARKYLWPLICSAAVIGLLNRGTSIVDSHDAAVPSGVTLSLPTGYVAMSPLSRLMDALSLLSVPQTLWLFGTAALLAIIAVFFAPRGSRQSIPRRLSTRVVCVLIVIASLEAATILLPRPMAKLTVADPQTLVVDFHSHTNASHDANRRFTPDDNRKWHSSGGFGAAYITDHVRFGGAALAMTKNPATAGDGFTTLSGVEGRYHRILSTVMLGLTEADTSILDDKGHLEEGIPVSGRPPVTIVAIPNGNIDSVTAASVDSLPHFAGIELVDGAPRGLGQLDREEAKIRAIASAQHLLLVSSSNNHGWGRTVAAWNLMSIPGWRNLSADSLAPSIERPFRERTLDAIVIIKRVRPRVYGAAVPLVLPVLTYQVLAALTLGERAVWLLWIWSAAIALALIRRSRPRASPDETSRRS